MTELKEFPAYLEQYDGQAQLTTLKINIHQLMQDLADENASPQRIAAVLHEYPDICMRLLRAANSSWASPAYPATNIETACIRLGYSLVKRMSIAIAVGSSFNPRRCMAFDLVRFWTTSMLVSDGAGFLAGYLPDNGKYGSEFMYTLQTTGLLHNIGLLWLADNFPQPVDGILGLAATNSTASLDQVLAERLGAGYCRAGAWLSEQWRLPGELIAVIGQHRDPDYSGEHALLVKLVGAASRMAAAIDRQAAQAENCRVLAALGVDYQSQAAVYQQLAGMRELMRERAKSMFFF